MTRKQKLLLNIVVGFLKQGVAVVCGFILPRYILQAYGSPVNGLLSSITQFLGFVTLLEMGIGPVIQANLYAPLAKSDHERISKIVISSERFFRRIALIFLVYIVFLLFFFPLCVKKEFSALFSISLILIVSAGTFARYFFGITYQLLLKADQKAFIPIAFDTVTIILNTVCSVFLILRGATIHTVMALSSIFFVLRPLILMWYVRHHYHLNRKLRLTEEPIQQKWNGFSQHIATVINVNIDVLLLSLFSTMTNISIYMVYYLVAHGVNSIMMISATGLESFFGNMIAKGEKKTLYRSFEYVETIAHFFVTAIFTVTVIMIIPFVTIYTLNINDANYNQPVFGPLLVWAYGFQCLRVPYFRMIKAAGHFKQTQNGAFIAIFLNILVSILLVFKMGLPGIAIGTVVAMAYHTIYFVVYLRKNILNRPGRYFLYHLGIDVLASCLSILLTRSFSLSEITYSAWVVMAIKVTVVTFCVSLVVYLPYIIRLFPSHHQKKREGTPVLSPPSTE